MKKKTKKGSFWQKLIFFILGMLAMMILDMIFHFNNSVEAKVTHELNKAQRKIENSLK